MSSAARGLLESPQVAAVRRLTEATRDAADAWRALNRVLAASYLSACAADPGLARAYEKARRAEPEIGWLDIAVRRERERAREHWRRGRP